VAATILLACAPLAPVHDPGAAVPAVYLWLDGDGAREIEKSVFVSRDFAGLVDIDGKRTRCRVSIHGGATRADPKHSYRIETFGDGYPPRTTGKRVYSAQYSDPGLCRYRLADYFFGLAGMMRPALRAVRLYIQGEYRGYYLEIEAVDSAFFARRRLPLSSLYKTVAHTQFTRQTGMVTEQAFEKKLPEDDRSFTDIDSLIRILDKGITEHSRGELEKMLDVWNALDYYAVCHLVGHVDGVTNNLYLYFDPRKRSFVIIPWDLDQTFRIPPVPFFVELDNRFFEKMARVPVYRRYLIERMHELFGLDEALARLDSLYAVSGPAACQGPYAAVRDVDCDDEIEAIRRFLRAIDSVLATL
jgi:spore coat protein CotH